MTDTKVLPERRTSEVEFLMNLPRMVRRWHVLHAEGYSPGDATSYPTMMVVLYERRTVGLRKADKFATAWLVWNEDQEYPRSWTLNQTETDFRTLNAARENAHARATA